MNGFDRQIRFCISPDNHKIAYVQTGEGLPLVSAGNWLANLENDTESFIWRHWLKEFSVKYRLVRYDQRGFGLSTRKIEDFSLAAQVADISTVAGDADVGRFSLIAVSNGCSTAIVYAAQNPEKVERLILCGGAVNENAGQSDIEKFQKFLQSVKSVWGNETSQSKIAGKIFPEISQQQVSELAQFQQKSTSRRKCFSVIKNFF